MKAIHVLLSLAPIGVVGGACAAAALTACVPTGSAPPFDAGPAPSIAPTFRPSLNVMTAVFEDDFDRPDATESAVEVAASTHDGGHDAGREASSVLSPLARDGGAEASPDESTASNLGPAWIPIRTKAWRIEDGKLCGQNAHNHPVWLNRTLPVNARIEFDAISYSDDGDLKAEVWGDGTSYATGTSYTNATSYLPILGGWKNTIHALARLNEHGKDRKEIHVDKESDDARQRPVQKGQTYHFKIERNDGKTIRWSVDGIDFATWNDPAPLAGQGHDHFGFNEWEAKVCFDNVKITPL